LGPKLEKKKNVWTKMEIGRKYRDKNGIHASYKLPPLMTHSWSWLKPLIDSKNFLKVCFIAASLWWLLWLQFLH